MNTIELFCGTKSFSNVAKELGYSTFTVDNDARHEPDLCKNILDMSSEELSKCDFLWASPPCEGFSVAAIGRNWNKDGTPKNDRGKLAVEIVLKTLSIIEAVKPTYWFIENPRGMLRKMLFMQELEFLMKYDGVRRTVTYCQYGDTRMKPTDIWTNMKHWNPKPICKNGSPCHIAAPRGSVTGTQGLANAVERSRVPRELIVEIFNNMKKSDETILKEREK